MANFYHMSKIDVFYDEREGAFVVEMVSGGGDHRIHKLLTLEEFDEVLAGVINTPERKDSTILIEVVLSIDNGCGLPTAVNTLVHDVPERELVYYTEVYKHQFIEKLTSIWDEYRC